MTQGACDHSTRLQPLSSLRELAGTSIVMLIHEIKLIKYYSSDKLKQLL